MSLPTVLSGPVNLPPIILFHGAGMAFVGLYLVLRPLIPYSQQKTTFLSKLAIPPGRTAETSTMLGATTLGLGCAYLGSAYVDMNKNQFLYLSVPVRLLLAGLGGMRLIADAVRIGGSDDDEKENWKRKGLSKEGKGEMAFLLIYDGLQALWLGWWLGEGGFSGRPPVY
jgi:hypothetical protein